MVQESTLQIFLTIYHGSLLGTFVYDYVIRNICRVVANGPNWAYVSNIAMGVIFAAVIVWAILSVWAKVKRNLLICWFFLVLIFIIRLAVSINLKKQQVGPRIQQYKAYLTHFQVGIPDTMDKYHVMPRHQYVEELAVYITQMLVHFFGIIATYILYKNS